MNEKDEERKTLIGILASHDSPEKNNELARLLEKLCNGKNKDLLSFFHFLFTGGTYNRIITGKDKVPGIVPVDSGTSDFLVLHSTSLPSRVDGGVTVLAYSVVQRSCSIIWPFLSPVTTHWLNPENLALMRLSDQWHVKRLMNSGSVTEWFEKEAEMDKDRNPRTIPLELELPGTKWQINSTKHHEGGYGISRPNLDFS